MPAQRLMAITGTTDFIQQLRDEATRINQAADMLEGVSGSVSTGSRGRGRPKGSLNKSTNGRGPGRPPGAKNKPKPVQARKRPAAKKVARKRSAKKTASTTAHHTPAAETASE